jgi:protein TonB
MEPVTSVLIERSHDSEGLRKMVGVSLILHVLAGVAIFAAPLLWPSPQAQDVTPIMTISLGSGAPGPMTGGANPMAGRPVQTTEPAKKPEAVRPPAERTPEMTLPVPKGKPLPKTPPKTEVEEGRGHTPARGAEVRPGSAFGETGAQGAGFGLSTGGVGGGGSYLDVSNFCCPDYLTMMIARIQSNWTAQQGIEADVMIKFTVERDGTLADIAVEQSSNYFSLDTTAQRAVARTAKLPPLPAAYTGDQLTVHLKFEYRR